ncbi:hypothetical protein R3W88_004498 [Solanum pinnatisectum]|uniref:Uncharacterized protein n=1 Tax=Solanum pinnatisectum TaxID=50273 RepID=A0AAV9KBW3_9SOLN|nr:hypothetical protein R3W88_004498 [Solanum pinnatisectum]
MPLHCLIINHLAYADNIVIFSNGKSSSLRLIMNCINDYEISSDQLVNRDKSFFFPPPRTAAQRINRIRRCTCFMDKTFPFAHLGCPLYVSRKLIVYFDNMVSKVVKRLNGWHGKFLSYGGKIILIKSVLQSLPLYTLSPLTPPKGTLALIEKHLANFFWGNSQDHKNYHWSSWANLCVPCDEGGIGIRSMEDFSNIFAMKRWWRLRTSDSLWVAFVKQKYCIGADMVSKK